MECKQSVRYIYCTLRTVVHFTWEMCALVVPLKLAQLGYKYVCMYVCMYVYVLLTFSASSSSVRSDSLTMHPNCLKFSSVVATGTTEKVKQLVSGTK